MAHFIPESWRHSLAHLRANIHDTIDRWWHHNHTPENGSTLSVRRVKPEIVEDHTSWLSSPSLFSAHLPRIDVEQTDDDVFVTAELPGLEKDDFTVDLSGERLLRIRGEKKQSSEKKSDGMYYAECSYGAFARTVPLPCEIDAEHASATYKQGTLRITLPKTERAKASRVKVQVHEST